MARREGVDETDMAILREIFVGDGGFWRNERVTLEAVSTRVGVHRNTVAARVRRLTADRVFLPAALEFEPGRLGLVAAMPFFEMPRDARTAATRGALLAIDGVQSLWEYAEGWSVVVYADSPAALERSLLAAKRLARPVAVTLDIDSQRDYPPFEPLALTPTDVRLLSRMLADSRAPFRLLAREFGVPAMTLKRRFDRLRAAGAVCCVPGGDGPAEGMFLGHVVADLPGDPGAVPAVLKRLLRQLPRQLFRNLTSPRRAHVIVFGRSARDLDSALETAQGVPGIRSASLRVFHGMRSSPAWRPWIERVLERRARRVPVVGTPLPA